MQTTLIRDIAETVAVVVSQSLTSGGRSRVARGNLAETAHHVLVRFAGSATCRANACYYSTQISTRRVPWLEHLAPDNSRKRNNGIQSQSDTQHFFRPLSSCGESQGLLEEGVVRSFSTAPGTSWRTDRRLDFECTGQLLAPAVLYTVQQLSFHGPRGEWRNREKLRLKTLHPSK